MSGGHPGQAGERRAEAVEAGERGEHILGPHGTSKDGGAGEALERRLEAAAEVGQRGRRRVGGEEGPRRRGEGGGRGGRGVEEVDECGGVGVLGPAGEEPVQEERGLADAAGPVE